MQTQPQKKISNGLLLLASFGLSLFILAIVMEAASELPAVMETTIHATLLETGQHFPLK